MKLKEFLHKNTPMTKIDWLVDAVLAAGVFGFGLLQITVMSGLIYPDDFTRRLLGMTSVTPTLGACLYIAATCVPLIFRQILPWPMFILSTVFWFVGNISFDSSVISIVAPLALMFTVTYICGRLQGAVAGLLMAGCVVLSYALVPSTSMSMFLLMQNLELVLAVALGGLAFRTYQEYLQETKARLEQASLAREKEAQRRVEEERLHIAREIHDITAHSLSAVNVQASLALRLIDVQPEAAKDSVRAIKATSKEALEEMRGVVNVMRAGAESAPTQGMNDVDDLAKYLRAAGLECTLSNSGYAAEAVPAYIDIALFGIAREAVTNVVRHAGAKRVSLNYGICDQGVFVEVLDDGSGYPGNAGNGVIGMQERAHVLGGTLQISAVAPRGTRVFAVLPLSK